MKSNTRKSIQTLTRAEAIAKGYRPLTQPYHKGQMEWLERALTDLRTCNIVLVETTEGPEIWRAATELKTHFTTDAE
jgi:hypothetical protein